MSTIAPFRLHDLAVDPDPYPRPAPVGPGSAYAAVSRAVAVDPEHIAVAAPVRIADRDMVPLRSWHFRADEDGVGRDRDFAVEDTSGWRPVAVPHTWSRSEPDLVDHKGPCWYGRDIVMEEGRHHQLRFGGLDYVAAVFADGRLLGHHEGGFTPVAFDLEGPARKVHIAVRVDDPAEPALLGPDPLTQAKRKVKGVLEFHDSRPGGHSHGVWFSPLWGLRWGTGGMVQPAWIVRTGQVRLEATFVTAAAEQLSISWVMTNAALHPVNIVLRSTIEDGTSHPVAGMEVVATVPAGASRIGVTARTEEAVPWTATTGGGHVTSMYGVATEVSTNGQVSDVHRTRFGVRTVEMPMRPDDQYQLRIDGRRTYVRAANYIAGVWFPELSERTFRTDLRLAAASGHNSLGPHAHILPDHFYDAADDAGMVVYQDFPLNLAHDPDGAPLFDGGPTMGEASLLLAAEAAYHLYNHPSIVYWCGHNEPAYQLGERFVGDHPDIVSIRDRLLGAPNEEALDDERVALWSHIDPGRSAFKASGLGATRDVGDVHTYTGSLTTDPTTAVTSTEAAFMSEFGAWTPNFSAAADAPGAAGDWPPDPATVADWEHRTHIYFSNALRAGRPERYPDFSTWTFASQLWGGAFLKLAIESFRRRKWAPFGGHRYHLLVDHWGDAGAGVVDKHRLAQAHFWALAAANRRILPVVGVLPSMRVEPDRDLVLPTWIINDTDRDLRRASLRWTVMRLDPQEAYVIGVDDPAIPHRFGTPEPPYGDLVVLPRTTGTDVASGHMTVTVPADGAVETPPINVRTAGTTDPLPHAVLIQLDVGDQVINNWGAFVVAPPAWVPSPGIAPMPRFALTLRGDGPYRVARRWTGDTIAAGMAGGEKVVPGLPPDQYCVETRGRTAAVDLFGDVELDLVSGAATAASGLPWPFDPAGRCSC